jgi:hypothetical protein
MAVIRFPVPRCHVVSDFDTLPQLRFIYYLYHTDSYHREDGTSPDDREDEIVTHVLAFTGIAVFCCMSGTKRCLSDCSKSKFD